MFSKTAAFFKTEIWRLRLSDYSRPTVFFIRQAQVIALAGRRFGEDKCKFRAAALTYHSLLSIVPLLAMIFGIASKTPVVAWWPRLDSSSCSGRS